MTKVKWQRGGNAAGTGLIDTITVPYTRLVELFGEPDAGDMYKVDVEWTLTINGHVATIYNWKDGPSYGGRDGTPVEQITDWHVGGIRRESLWLVQQIIDGC